MQVNTTSGGGGVCVSAVVGALVPVAAERGYVLPQGVPRHPLHVALVVVKYADLLTYKRKKYMFLISTYY